MLKCTSPSVSANNMLLTVLSNFQLPHTLIWKEWPWQTNWGVLLEHKHSLFIWIESGKWQNWIKMIAAAIQRLLTLCLGNREKTDLPFPSLPVAKEYILFSSCDSRFLSFISLSSWWRVALFIQYVQHVVLHHWSCALYTVFFNIIRSLYAIMHLHNLLPLHVWVTIFVDVVCCCTLIYFIFLAFFSPPCLAFSALSLL